MPWASCRQPDAAKSPNIPSRSAAPPRRPAAGLTPCLDACAAPPPLPLPQGHGDPERDYQLLAQQAADDAAAQLGGSAAKRQRLGAAAESAVGGAALAAAALTPASARGKAGLTPRDVFDDLATPRVDGAVAGKIGRAHV